MRKPAPSFTHANKYISGGTFNKSNKENTTSIYRLFFLFFLKCPSETFQAVILCRTNKNPGINMRYQRAGITSVFRRRLFRSVHLELLPSLGACVLGHSLGALRHGVFGQLSWQKQAHGGLNLSGCDGGALVVMSQA